MLFSFFTVFQLFFGNKVVVNVLKKATSFLGTGELIILLLPCFRLKAVAVFVCKQLPA